MYTDQHVIIGWQWVLVSMADRTGAKLPKAVPDSKSNNRQKVPRPRPKPKPKRGPTQAQLQVQEPTGKSAEYAELKAVRRQSDNHYEPLSDATREKIQIDVGDAKTEQEKTVQASVADSDSHYIDVIAQPVKEEYDLSAAYENHQFDVAKTNHEELNEKDFNRNCFYVYWKAILVACLSLSVIFVVFSLLVMAAVSLAHASSNTNSYQELHRTAQHMAEQIVTLEK